MKKLVSRFMAVLMAMTMILSMSMTAFAADAADADAILDAEMQTPDEGVESPGREIREMLKNHDEPLEEWKD